MGKPRMILLIRHAQSEGNKNRDIHQFIPDHRVKLTPHGITQAEEAGRQLRSLLKPDDTIQFFTSPYRRTRETTEGILRTLTSDDPTPSPFPRNKIKVFEEPRLREQDFGNFQPCSAEMERMWQERADYGHFFYRIPDGESAADAYDRISGFNESLWRQFGDEDFPSVCVVVTHGMMTRVFLMKWYHWSVEYFEDLRNINHCEFIKMKRSDNSGKYILENELRTWSDLKRRAAADGGSSTSRPAPGVGQLNSSPTIPTRRWGGCINGCNHDKQNWPKRPMRKNTMEYQSPLKETLLPPAAQPLEKDESTTTEIKYTPSIEEPSPARLARKQSATKTIPEALTSPNDASNDSSSSETEDVTSTSLPRNGAHIPRTVAIARHLAPPHRPAGDGFSDDSDYFPGMQHLHGHHRSKLRASSKQRQGSKERKLARRQTEKGWKEESGMGIGRRADTLGDGGNGTSDEAGLSRVVSRENPVEGEDGGMQGPILKEALKGDMIVEHSEEERDINGGDVEGELAEKLGELGTQDVEKMEDKEKKGFGEIY